MSDQDHYLLGTPEALDLQLLVPKSTPPEMLNAIQWLLLERDAYQTKKFDYEKEGEQLGEQLTDYWKQQINTYFGRIEILPYELPNGRQAVAKLAATTLALLEHVIRHKGPLPKPGVSSGTVEDWDVPLP